jgi:hypothetical protein
MNILEVRENYNDRQIKEFNPKSNAREWMRFITGQDEIPVTKRKKTDFLKKF